MSRQLYTQGRLWLILTTLALLVIIGFAATSATAAKAPMGASNIKAPVSQTNPRTSNSTNSTDRPNNSILCVATTAVTTTMPCANSPAYTSIQTAIDIANADDEIRIAQGMYTGVGASVVTITKALTLIGGYTGTPIIDWNTPGSSTLTSIDGQNSRRGIQVQGAISTTIQNLEVFHGGILNNNGTVNVVTSTLNLNGGSSSTSNGTFNLSSGALLSIGTQTFDTGTAFIGAGVARIERGTVTIIGTITSQNLELANNGRLNGTGSISPILNWTGGDMGGNNGTLNIPAGASLHVSSGPGSKSLTSYIINNAGTIVITGPAGLTMFSNGNINNASIVDLTGSGGLFRLDGGSIFTNTGTVNWSGTDFGSISMFNMGVFNNLSTGIFDAQADGSTFGIGEGGIFNNNGIFRKSAGAGITSINGAYFNNTGTVEALTGTLDFGRPYTQTTGTTRLNGGDIGGTLNIQGGSLTGAGTINGTVVNSGQVSPGTTTSLTSTGILTVTGSYTQNPTGSLNIKVGGYNPGTQFDRLSITGQAHLTGTLNTTVTNGFTPNAGDLFRVINCGPTLTTTFATVTGPDFGNSLSFYPNYNATNVKLVVARLVTVIGHLTWQGRPAQPNALQQLPITLTIKSGTYEQNYAVQSTDASGFFTVTAPLYTGAFNWRAKGPDATIHTSPNDPPGFLANSGTFTVLSGTPTTNVEIGLMKAGDCNNDNLVNASDFNILKPAFGRSIGQPGYDNRADFNGDQLVSALDFNLMKQNFGTGGAPPLRPGGHK